MRVFKAKWFVRFARKKGISDTQLSDSVLEMERGLIDSDLGGGLIKKRVARTGGGKRGGYRSVIAYCSGARSVFLYGFPKNDKSNLTESELVVYKELARVYLQLSDAAITKELETGGLKEVSHGKKKI